MTDDQDYMLNSTHPAYMPNLHRLLRLRGLEVQHFVTSVASCCPSRTSFLTGRYCHNTNITSNAWPRGGFVKFMANGLDEQYLPVWLQAAGYDTYYVGKLLNGLTEDSVRDLGCPRGWNVLDPLLLGDTGSSEELYYKDTPRFMPQCGSRVEAFPDAFIEAVLRERALRYIDRAADSRKPFFMFVGSFAPHDAEGGPEAVPEVEVQYRGLYRDVELPKSPNFGVRPPDKIGYYWPYNSKDAVGPITARYRARLQALRSVDDTVAALLSRLACRGLLANTVFIYTSDNGFKLGNHNIAQEKFTQYEEDVRLPLLLAGPGIPRGVATGARLQVTMTDLTATIVQLAGASVDSSQLDGAPMPLEDLLTTFGQSQSNPAAEADVSSSSSSSRRPSPAAVPPDNNIAYYCAPSPPPDPPLPPAPPRSTSPPDQNPGERDAKRRRRQLDASAGNSTGITTAVGSASASALPVVAASGAAAKLSVELAAAGSAAAASVAVGAAAAVCTPNTEAGAARGGGPISGAGPVTATLPQLLGAWRPGGWSWHHDLWLEDHADALGLRSWADQVIAEAAAATTNVTSAAAAATAAVAQRPLPVVDGAVLIAYSRQRVRRAVAEAQAMRRQRAAVVTVAAAAAQTAAAGTGDSGDDSGVGGEAEVGAKTTAPRSRSLAAEAATATGPVAGPLPQSRLSSWSNVALIESWLDGVFKGKDYRTLRACTTFQAFEGTAPWTCYKYTVLCNPVLKQTPVLTNVELYDLGQDPAEVKDRTKTTPYPEPTALLIDRLDAVLTVMSYCTGELCRNPFLRIHPDGGVTNLAQAMQPQFNNLYRGFKKLSYKKCDIYYDPANEWPDPYLAGYTNVMPGARPSPTPSPHPRPAPVPAPTTARPPSPPPPRWPPPLPPLRKSPTPVAWGWWPGQPPPPSAPPPVKPPPRLLPTLSLSPAPSRPPRPSRGLSPPSPPAVPPPARLAPPPLPLALALEPPLQPPSPSGRRPRARPPPPSPPTALPLPPPYQPYSPAPSGLSPPPRSPGGRSPPSSPELAPRHPQPSKPSKPSKPPRRQDA